MKNKQYTNTKQNLEHLIINKARNIDDNIIVLDIKYLKEVQELYKQTYKAKSNPSQFRIISSYHIIDDKTMQIYVTDEYKDIILNDIDY